MTFECTQTNCKGLIIQRDDLYICDTCGTIYKQNNDEPPKEYKKALFKLVKYNMYNLFMFFLMIFIIISGIIFLSLYYAIVLVFIGSAFVYSAFEMGKIK